MAIDYPDAKPEAPSAYYSPSPEDSRIISEIRGEFADFRRARQPHELQWMVNAAFLRNQSYIEANSALGKLNVPPAPPHRIRLAINRVRPKITARRANFLKNRTKVEVIPATPDQDDRLNARASKRSLDYVWRKDNLEQKKAQAIMTAEYGGKGYWWLHWDPTVMGQVVENDPLTGEPIRQEGIVGDVRVEVGSPYELLIADPTEPLLANQPKILRVKLRPLAEMKARYPEHAAYLTAEVGDAQDVFRYERQIANLNTSGLGGSGMVELRDRGQQGGAAKDGDKVLVIEEFCRPTADYPKGRYRVLVGSVLVKNDEELPYQFWDMSNPFPVVEFVDSPSANQYYSTTLIEQLIPLQREYNLSRSKLAEHLRTSVHPKIIVYKQHRMPDSAWTAESGEVVTLNGVPGLGPPIVVQPPPIAADLWRAIELMRGEFDDISQVFPAAEGKAGTAKSGFQTNLLQEATDRVHQPDVMNMNAALEEALFKIRRIQKLGYTTARLISAVGRNFEPEVFEFQSSQIDEHADIRVESNLALPDNKALRITSIMDMVDKGLMGNMQNPEDRRRTLSLMELGGPDDAIDDARQDEDLARIENREFQIGKPVPNPNFWESHRVHYDIHTDLLKSPEARKWPHERRMMVVQHVIGHLALFDPLAAGEAAMMYQLPVPPQAVVAQQQMAQQQMMQQGGPPAPPGSAPAGPPA